MPEHGDCEISLTLSMRENMMSTNKTILKTMTALLVCAAAAHGSVLFDFDNLNPGTVGGQGSWSGDSTVVAGGLSYQSGGVHHAPGTQRLRLTGGWPTPVTSVPLPSPIAIPAFTEDGQTQTMYFSFLLNNSVGGLPTFLTFTDSPTNLNGGVGARVVFSSNEHRLQSQSVNFGGTQAVVQGSFPNPDPEGSLLTFALAPAETHLIVGKVNFRADPDGLGGFRTRTAVQVTANPNTRTEANHDQPFSLLGQGGVHQFPAFTHLRISTGFSNEPDANINYIDQIRFGDTWDSVVVIPEPGTVGLIGLGVIVLLRRFRKKAV